MLKLMRYHAKSWLIKIILGAIVLVFVFWGVGSFRSDKGGRVALVNGETITIEEYRGEFNKLIDQLRQRFGNSLNDETIMPEIKRQALYSLINQKLMFQEAEKLNIRVSEKELADTIGKIEAFQTAGVFDEPHYRKVLKRNNLTPEEFEDNQRKFILIEKLRDLILSSIKVSDSEAMEWYNWSNAFVNIDFVLFEPERYKNIKVSADEVKTCFDNRKESYKTDPMIKARFLQFNPETYKSNISITDDDVQNYYKENIEEFRTDKTVEARHILIKIDQGAGPEAVEEGRNKALDILKKIEEGKDFGELALQYSACPSKNNGGRLGAFKKEAMVKPFADMAFSLKEEEISEPVLTRFGWHIIKVEKINEESTLSFEEAKKSIRKNLTVIKLNDYAYNKAEVVYNAAVKEDDLIKAAAEQNLKLLTTDFFTKKGPDKGVKYRKDFALAAFNLSVMEFSDILNIGDGYYIIQVVEKNPAKIPELNDVMERVTADLIKIRQNEKAAKDAKEFLSDLKIGKSIGEECKKFDVFLKTSGFFKRNDSVPGIGYEREVIEAAFSLSEQNKTSEDIIKGAKGYYVVSLKERKDPALEGFDKEKANILKGLLQQKQLAVFDDWLLQVRNNSDITIKKDLL
ncbi:MAG: SurA N-terminal domain-containing protein [Deltaproteobacteria bacterium]|nr:SurA N-terminal domain-containing protein [Deltaproteobacteria bacterium]MBW2662135.1 SurA N-terminal domain-containing protein [Deltaproteobacteria bacterium]